MESGGFLAERRLFFVCSPQPLHSQKLRQICVRRKTNKQTSNNTKHTETLVTQAKLDEAVGRVQLNLDQANDCKNILKIWI